MATTADTTLAYVSPVADAAKRKPSFAQRFFAALKASREASARRELARHAHMIAGWNEAKATKREELPF